MDKLHKTEARLYILFSLIAFIGFCGYLLFRILSRIYIGPIILGAYIIIAVFTLVLFIFARSSSVKARYVFWQFFLGVLFLFCVDIFLRAINFPAVTKDRQVKSSYNRLKKIISLRESGLTAVPFVEPRLNFGNLPNACIVGDEESDGLIVYQSDELGFRNKHGLYSNSRTFDVFLLGDSFAQGCWVPDGFTIADGLRQKGFCVYNAGLGGSGLNWQFDVFLEYGAAKKPKNTVVILVEGIILNRAINEKTLPKRKAKDLKDTLDLEYFKSLLKYMEKDCRIGNGRTAAKGFFGQSKILLLMQNCMQNYRGEGFPDCAKIRQQEDMAREVFGRFKKITAGYGGNFIVVYLPYARFYFKDWPDCEYAMVSSLCAQMNIPFVDMVKVFAAYPDPKSFYSRNHYVPTIGGHCNRRGYALTAEEVSKKIK